MKVIQDAPALTDLQALQSFFGMAGFYAKFLHNYSDEVEPLRDILRGDKPFHWSEAADVSFKRIKFLLSNSPALATFDASLPTIVPTDASAYSLGAVLQRKQGRSFGVLRSHHRHCLPRNASTPQANEKLSSVCGP